MANDYEIFEGKSLSDLFKDIYENTEKNRKQLDVLTKEIVQFIKDGDTAVQIVPMIKEYMEIGVKNDEHLIKLATVIQRIEIAQAKGDGGDFDFSDLQDLLEEQEELDKELESKEKEQTEKDGNEL